jgi:nucleoside-diphosphate-sugar epimerase
VVVLVTGGCGFVGAHTVRALLSRGQDVVAYDSLVAANSIDIVLSEAERSRVTLAPGDVTDLPLLLRTCQEHAVEAIVHLAFSMGIVHENVSRAIAVNCQGAANVFEAAALLGMRKVVWSGSNAVFGPPARYSSLPLTDDAPHYPDTMYGASKSFVERMAAHYRREREVISNGARLVIMYGPGRLRGGAMHVVDAFLAAIEGRPYEVPFPSELQGFLYVADAADCLALLIGAEETATHVYNVAGETCTVWDYARRCVEVVGPAELTRGSGTFPAQLTWELSNDALERELGFRPARSLADGLAEWREFTRALS